MHPGWRRQRTDGAARPTRAGWGSLALVSLAVLVFGVVVALAPPGTASLLLRADALASAGLGLFGLAIVLVPYRRGERWAWWVLWFYPLFWLSHLLGGLPPGTDHVHQVVLLGLSLLGLLLPWRDRPGSAEKPAGARPPPT